MASFHFILMIYCAYGILLKDANVSYQLTQNLTWSEAKLACVSNNTRMASLPITPVEKLETLHDMLTRQVSEVWVDLKTQAELRWTNQTKFEHTIAQAVGSCGAFRDGKIYLFHCNAKRRFVCASANNSKPFCGKKLLTWNEAKTFCELEHTGLFLHALVKGCDPHNAGYWIGFYRHVDVLIPKIKNHTKKREILKQCNLKVIEGEECGIIEHKDSELGCRGVPCNHPHFSFCKAAGIATPASNIKSDGNVKYLIALIVGIAIIVIVIILGFVLSRKYNQVKRERLQSMRDSHPYRPDRMSVAPPPYSPGGSAGGACGSLFPVQYSQTADNLWITEKPELECEAEMYCDISDSDSMTKRPEMPSPRSTIYDRLETPSDTSGSEGKIYQNRPGRPTPRRKRRVGPASKHSPAVMCSPSYEQGGTPRRSRSGKYGYTPSPTIAHTCKQQSPLPMHVRNQAQKPSPSSVRGPAHQHPHAHAHGNAPPQKEGPNIQSHGGYREPLSFTGSMTRQKAKGRQQAESPTSYASVYKYNRAISAEVKPGQAESLGVSAYFASDESDEDF